MTTPSSTSSEPPDSGLGWLDPDRSYDAAMRLLGRQLIDPAGRFCGKADDLEITVYPDGSAAVTTILTGPGAWADGMPGFLGRWTTAIWRRLHPDTHPQPTRIAVDQISDLDSAVHIASAQDNVITGGTEHWTRDHIISKIPGAGHDQH